MPGNEFATEETPELAEANRKGDPYLVYRDAHERQRVLSLPDTWDRITIGRGMGADVALTWDPDVSRVHAELARLADDWTVIDDGLSRNGTFVNDRRVEGRRRPAGRRPAEVRGDAAPVRRALPGRGADPGRADASMTPDRDRAATSIRN